MAQDPAEPVLAVRTHVCILTPHVAQVQVWINDETAGRLHVPAGLACEVVDRLQGQVMSGQNAQEAMRDRAAARAEELKCGNAAAAIRELEIE